MRIRSLAFAAVLAPCSPAVVAAQAPASGVLAPQGSPERPPVRVNAGGACVVDLVQKYTLAGTLSGALTLDYRILVAGPCGSPAGSFDEEWIAHGEFSGSASGRSVTASVLYTADVRAGSVSGTVILRGDVEADLRITGEFAERRLAYEGVLTFPQKGETP